MIVKFKEWLEAHDFRSMNPYDQVDLLVHRDEVNDKDTYYRYISEILYKLGDDIQKLLDACRAVGGHMAHEACGLMSAACVAASNAAMDLDIHRSYSDVYLVYSLKNSFRAIASVYPVIKSIENSYFATHEQYGKEISELALNIQSGLDNLRKVKLLTNKLPNEVGMQGNIRLHAKLDNLLRRLKNILINCEAEETITGPRDHNKNFFIRVSRMTATEMISIIEKIKLGRYDPNLKIELKKTRLRASSFKPIFYQELIQAISELEQLMNDKSILTPDPELESDDNKEIKQIDLFGRSIG